MKRISAIVLFVVGMCVLFGCPSTEEKNLQIGALYPRSGSLALLGEESWRGAEIARLERNRQGGIAGRQIEFAEGDCHDVAAARSEAERLIEQKKVGLIIGSYSSSRSMAATEVAARKNIPYFELGAIANAITGRGYRTVWRTNGTAADFSRSQVDFITDWLAAQLGKPPADVRVSIAHEDSDYGTSVAASFKELATEVGIQLVSVEPYASTSSDLSSVIFRLRQADPDVVIAVSYAQDAILLSRQAYELELKKPFFGTGGGHSLKSFQEALGSEADGILNVDFTQYEVKTEFTPGLEEFLALYRETFKEDPKSGHSLANYMGAKVVFDILEKTAGSLEADKIREVAMALDIEAGATATGWGVKFDDNGQNARAKPLITQWREGKLVTVWPAEGALMAPIMPE
jgi:branched-chain amino acid transport system substrate-binding protein